MWYVFIVGVVLIVLLAIILRNRISWGSIKVLGGMAIGLMLAWGARLGKQKVDDVKDKLP